MFIPAYHQLQIKYNHVTPLMMYEAETQTKHRGVSASVKKKSEQV